MGLLKIVNKFLLVFTLLVSFLFFSVWKFAQTDFFISLVTNKASLLIKKQAGLDISFNNFKVQFFPPATILKNVVIKNNGKGFSLAEQKTNSITFSKISILFSFLDIFSSNLKIDEIIFEKGSIFYRGSTASLASTPDKLTIQEIYKTWDKIIPRAVTKLKVINTNVHIDKLSAIISYLALQKKEERIQLQTTSSNITYGNHKIDEIILDAFLTKTKVEFNSLKIKKAESVAEINGKIINRNINFNIIFNGTLESFINDYRIDRNLLTSAAASGKLKISGTIEAPSILATLQINNLVSHFLQLDSLALAISTDEKRNIWLDSAIGMHGPGSVTTNEKIKLYSFQEKTMVFPEINLNFKEMHTNTILHFLKETMNNLTGFVTGHISISKTQGKDFLIKIKEKTKIEKLRLLSSKKGSKNILENDRIDFNNSQFLITPEGKISLSLDLKIKERQIISSGNIFDENIEISASSKEFDLEEFGPISGQKLWGQGPIKMLVKKNATETNFLFDVEIKKFQVIDLNIGNLSGELLYDLKKNQLHINKSKISKSFDSSITLNGSFDFGENGNYKLSTNFSNCDLDSTYDIFSKFLFEYKPLLEKTKFWHDTKLSIEGNIYKPQLSVTGSTRIKQTTILGETIDKIGANISYKNGALEIINFDARKNLAKIKGNMFFDFPNDYFEYDVAIKKMKLKDVDFYKLLGLGYDGELDGTMYGSGAFLDFSHRLELEINNGTVDNMQVSSSRMSIWGTNKKINIKGNLLGETIKLESFINLRPATQKEKSTLQLSINETNIKNIFGLLSAHNISNSNIQGNIRGKLDASFNISDLETVDLNSQIEQLSFGQGNVFFKILEPANLIIEKGVIKKWNLFAEDSLNGGYIKNSGEGNLKDNFKIFLDYSYDSNLLTLLSPKIVDVKGHVSGRAILIGHQGKFTHHITVRGKNIDLRLRDIPYNASNINFYLIIDDKKILLDNFEAQYGNGSIASSGVIDFNVPDLLPMLNLNFSLKQVQIPFMSNSSAVLSGNLTLSGKERPYNVSGKISLLYGEIAEDFAEFYKLKIVNNSLEGVLPSEKKTKQLISFNYNIDVTLLRELALKNNFLDLNFLGSGRLYGIDSDLRFSGNLNAIKQTSRFKFKGHEFKLEEGNISFFENKGKQDINLKLKSIGQISNYKISLLISGDPDNIILKMDSDPPLPQNDILSLLAIGVTTSATKDLAESDLGSVATLGLGNLIADQLQLSKNLANPLGLQLSVSPELGEKEINPLENVSSSTEITNKVRSTTLVKLKMKLATDLDLSLSSTIGGATGQKQEMHIDYNINKNMSIQGVYESKSSSDSASETTNSAGFDLIYRKSFK